MHPVITRRLTVQKASATATILAIVTAVGGLIVGLGIVTSAQEGLIVAATTGAIAVAGVIAHAIHTGSIEPTGLAASVMAVVAQTVALVVSFAWISNVEAGTILSVVSAVVIAGVTIAHALLSKTV